MKRILIIAVITLSLTGCENKNIQKSTEVPKTVTEITTEKKEENIKKHKNEATPDQKWTDIIPNYKKIFKGTNITFESIIETPSDKYGALYVTLEGVTQEQFEKYVKQASKRYINVHSKGSVDSTDTQYGNYTADDGVYQITLILTNNIDNHDKLDASIACGRNTWNNSESMTETK